VDFLSDNSKKEKRSLLAAGCGGIVIGLLKIYPTEINFAGLRFDRPSLPIAFIAVLGTVTLYFMFKYWLSHIYERSDAEMERIATEIRDGKVAMDIGRLEQDATTLLKESEDKRKLAAAQLAHENNRLATVEEKSTEEISSQYENEMIKLQGLEETKKKALEELEKEPNKYGKALYLESKQTHMADLAQIQDTRLQAEKKQIFTLAEKQGFFKNERVNAQGNYEAILKLAEELGEKAIATSQLAVRLKHAQKTQKFALPLQTFMELYFPLAVGALGIACLVWLYYYPPDPRPLVIPGI
jgi:hypothetical protein